jgi:hypothetical protein
MSIFAKKPESKWEAEPTPRAPEINKPPAPFPPTNVHAYGIADAIQLMRSLPVDQNVDLVVRVVRATLASLNVRVQDIIEDATRKEKSTEDGIAALHAKVTELEKELEIKRREITALEGELKETTGVKERLQLAEKFAVLAPSASAIPLPTPPESDATPGPKVGSSIGSSIGSSVPPLPTRLAVAKPPGHEEPMGHAGHSNHKD